MIRDEVEGIRVGDPQGLANSAEASLSSAGSSTTVKNPTVKGGKGPLVIWLNASLGDTPPNPWINLTWGTDTLDDFAQALITSQYFDQNGIPDPSGGDTICGMDSAGVIVVLKVTAPVAGGLLLEQKPAPAAFK